MRANKKQSADMSAKVRQLELMVAADRRRAAEQARNPQALERRKQAAAANAQSAIARSNMLIGGNARASTKRANKTAKGRTPMFKHPHISAWALQQAHPMSTFDATPLWTNNVVQSASVSKGRTTRLATFTVPAGRARQFVIMHRGQQAGSPFNGTFYGTSIVTPPGSANDQVATHCMGVSLRTASGVRTDYCVGPVAQSTLINWGGTAYTVTLPACWGALSAGGTAASLLTGLASLNSLNGTGIDWEALTPTTAPPFSGATHGHFRYIVTGCELRMTNTTPQGDRGGSITTCMLPYSAFGPESGGTTVSQNTFAQFPNYRVHPVDQELRFVMPTRTQDLTFAHLSGVAISQANQDAALQMSCSAWFANGASYVWINNPTGVEQSYTYELVVNHCLSGHLVTTIAEPAVLAPDAQPLSALAAIATVNKPTTTSAEVLANFAAAQRQLATPSGFSAMSLSPKNLLLDAGAFLSAQVPRLGL